MGTIIQNEFNKFLNTNATEEKNYRNGYNKKNVKTEYGDISINMPRDRNGEFNPELLPKREILSEGIKNQITSMYSKWMSTRDISNHIEGMYGTNLSATTISNITDEAMIEGKEWFNRTLDPVYPILFLDAVHFKVKQENRIITKAAYVASKDQREFISDLKAVYKATSEELAMEALNEMYQKWGKQYEMVLDSWMNKWDNLSTYFEYEDKIRKLIYTTNTLEGFNRQLRKITKTKTVFPNDEALLKCIYLAITEISKKWTSPCANWGQTIAQFKINFGDRVPIDII